MTGNTNEPAKFNSCRGPGPQRAETKFAAPSTFVAIARNRDGASLHAELEHRRGVNFV